MAPLAHVHAYKSVHTAAYLLSSGIISRACNDTACIRVYIHIYPPPRLPPSVVCSRVCQYRDPHANHRDRCAARNSTTTYDDDDDRIWVDLSSPPPPPNLLDFLVYHFSNYRDDNFSCLESTNLLAYSRKFSITSENTSNETPPSLYSSQEIVKVACAEKMAQNASADHPVRIISSPDSSRGDHLSFGDQSDGNHAGIIGRECPGFLLQAPASCRIKARIPRQRIGKLLSEDRTVIIRSAVKTARGGGGGGGEGEGCCSGKWPREDEGDGRLKHCGAKFTI